MRDGWPEKSNRTTVVYRQPPTRVYEAMPVGGGDVCAMVRVAESVDLHLGKSDSWGFSPKGDGTMAPQLLSPGHVTIHLTPPAAPAGRRVRFRQRLYAREGRVEAEIRDAAGRLRVSVYGDMDRHALVVEVEDRRRKRGPVDVDLATWRGVAQHEAAGAVLLSREEITLAMPSPSCRRLRPEEDPFPGRSLELAVGADCPAESRVLGTQCEAFGSLHLPCPPVRFRVAIACEVAPRGAERGAARRTLQRVLAESAGTARARHAAWWNAFWRKSEIHLEGDAEAVYFNRLWHLFFYQKACSSQGAYPAKFNGGMGLFERDRRSWRLGDVWQNDREHLWPLDAANHPELTRNVWRMQAGLLEPLRRFTRERWGVPGVVLTEWHCAWWASLRGLREPSPRRGAESTGGLGKDYPADYCTHIFSSGAELVQRMLEHVRHTGDRRFMREVAYPWLRGVCEFYVHFAVRGKDGRYHFAPANANETWWKVKDTLNDLCAVRVCFPEFLALAERYGRDQVLARRCRDILARLPALPTGAWDVVRKKGRSRVEVDGSRDVYAPAWDPMEETQTRNVENPECYVIFPWALTGMGARNVKRARRTFLARRFPLAEGWSQCAIQSARLGDRRNTLRILREHARRFQVFPYGGWYSCTDRVYRRPDGCRMPDCAYFDAAGVQATALQEMLLQSHPIRSPEDYLAVPTGRRTGASGYGGTNGGPLHVCPATPAHWSGRFTLHAMGGFLVSCEFRRGVPRVVTVRSERGNPLRLIHPWKTASVRVQGGGAARVCCGPGSLHIPTRRGCRYRITAGQTVAKQSRP